MSEKRYGTLGEGWKVTQEPVIGLATLQIGWGGLFDFTPEEPQHLVRQTQRGTPGPTLCGIDRFAKHGPAWAVAGGVDGPGIALQACSECVAVAQRDFPGLEVSGSLPGALRAFREAGLEVCDG